nr:MAG TPA: L SHAPED TAIL FIBER PROTEIN [Caudoviricetes sp.]
MIEITAVPGKVLMLGRQGENLARKVIFSVSGVRAEFGDGAFRLSARRAGESNVYPAAVTENGDTVEWSLTAADTQNAGRGSCELAYYAGDVRLKTWVYDTAVAKSLTGSPKTDPYNEFLDEVNRLAAEAAISQREAKNSENAAKNSEENAKASEDAAKTSEDNAAAYAQTALAAEKKSEQNAGYAASAATAAGQYAQNAATSATNAANSASAAETHEKGAKDAAAAAAKSAEGLADAVKRAKDAAASAQDSAGKTAADREAVAEMKTAAQTAQGNAEKAATAAAGSATSAGESATAAETSRKGAAEIKAQIDGIKAGIDTTKGEIDQAKADIDQTKTDTLAAKTAAETAAATATEKAAEIADSAAQIATNTENIETNAEDIDLLRRENTELRAKTDALWKLSEGKSYDFVEDAIEAYSKDVPTGCRFAQVEKIGGKTVARDTGELVSAGVEDVEVGFPEQSGSMVTISDGIDGHALDVTASWTPTQAGSGDPSPENIRPISGRDKITLTRTAGSDTQTATLSLPETIYGGSVDQDGNGMKEWGWLVLDGTEGWREDDAGDAKHRYALSVYNLGVRYEGAYKMCDRLKWTGSIAVNNGYDYGVYYVSSVWLVVFDKSNHFSGLDAWKSYLAAQKAAGTPMQIAYKLASPTTFTATGAKTITAKGGVNTVLSDAGNVKVKYSDDDYPIPDAVKALPGYGWSAAGNISNEIVRRADGWDYVQRVGLPATTDGYTILDTPTTTDITDLMTGALPLMTTEPGGTITMHHALADDGLTLDVPNTVKYIRDLKEVASSGTE